ncbi:MAG TPA: hypothetical protein DCZ95_05225 [Verrucomicrobia bacterium]|nr:hypothetical protein [Verrucomicrobiota bacterium]
MTTGQWIGIAGAVLGVIVGAVGAAIGVLCALRKTRGPKEKTFVIRVFFATLLVLAIFSGLKILLPEVYSRYLLLAMLLLLLPAIKVLRNRQRDVAIRDRQNNGADDEL